MPRNTPLYEYELREKQYNQQYKKANQQYNILSNLRLFIFLGIVSGIIIYYLGYHTLGSWLTLSTLIIFIIFVILHERVRRRKDRAFSLVRINQDAIKRITGKWLEFTDTGAEYINPNHHYSIDLDIFGQGSVFQWINSTFTFEGRNFLKSYLLTPEQDVVKIEERQVAIAELADKLDWRQSFYITGSQIKNAMNNPNLLFKWAEQENKILRWPVVIWGIRLITLITLISLVWVIFIDATYIYITAILLFIQFILFLLGLRINVNYSVTILHKDTISTFKKLLMLIEGETFTTPYLSRLQTSLINVKGDYASKQIKSLSFLVDMMSFKNSPLISFILNLFCLWDYHCLFALEKWKKQSGNYLKTWFMVIGRLEALSSLAIIRYDNPDWCNPQFTNMPQTVIAKNMGHPLLLSDIRVCNDLNIKGKGHILLITGSNMSGKSTLLRTVGLNLILAYAGAPVCANSFKCSLMDIHTSMRLHDNLEKSISSFYAELLRIRTIIERASEGSSVLFLVDEIFRGTNSKDRHIGAAVVIKKLSKMGAVGLVSTHDLELSKLELDKNIWAENYHFAESYVENEIIFDYKLREGVSTTTNAIYLMKMVGIEEI